MLEQVEALGTMEVENDRHLLTWLQTCQAFHEGRLHDDPRLDSPYLVRRCRPVNTVFNVTDSSVDDRFFQLKGVHHFITAATGTRTNSPFSPWRTWYRSSKLSTRSTKSTPSRWSISW